jgi:hypothetical protein
MCVSILFEGEHVTHVCSACVKEKDKSITQYQFFLFEIKKGVHQINIERNVGEY